MVTLHRCDYEALAGVENTVAMQLIAQHITNQLHQVSIIHS